MTPRPNAEQTYSTSEVAAVTETSVIQIESWCRAGLLHPQQEGTGHGFHRSFPSHEVTATIIIRELTRAGLSVPQMQQLFSVLRGKLNNTPPALRSAEMFASYIATVQALAQAFGKADNYDDWLTEAKACLARMQRDVRAVRPSSRKAETIAAAADARMRDLLLAMSRLPDTGLAVRAPQR